MAQRTVRLSSWLKGQWIKAHSESNAANHPPPPPRPLLNLTRTVFADVVNQCKKGESVAPLEYATIAQNTLLYPPSGDSRDYTGKIKKFITGAFSQSKPSAEQDDIQQKLDEPGLDKNVRRFQSLLDHPFFITPEEKANYLQSFIRNVQNLEFQDKITGEKMDWKTAYNKWEAKTYPKREENIHLACKNSKNPDVWKVYEDYVSRLKKDDGR